MADMEGKEGKEVKKGKKGKKLTELRVIDLKLELERRGLDWPRSGNKAALLERLSKAISEDGENPEEYLIVPPDGPCKTAPRKNSGTLSQEESIECSDNQKEENIDGQENVEKPKGEIKVEIKAEENDEKENEEKEVSSKKTEFQSEVKNNIKMEESLKQETKIQGLKATAENVQSSDKNELEKNNTANQTSNTSATVEANGIDNEDSINLTIGEDEENLLAEETESHDRHKDGGEKKKIEENSKKGDSKGGGRAEAGAGGKEGTTSGANVGTKNKQDGGDGGSKSAESSNKNQKRDEKDKKISQVSPSASSRNLWVSGLSSSTRATDLKQIFSKYGKVIGAKVVTNARTPGARCYGYVTMSSSEDAAKCIQHLHKTELHGRVISVEKAKGDSQQSHIRKRDTVNGKSEKKEEKEKPKDHDINERKEKEAKKETEEKGLDAAKKSDEKNESAESKKIEIQDKKEDPSKESDSRSTKSTSKKPESERGRREEKRIRTWDRDHRSHSRSRSRERRRRDDVLTFAKIREERERQRLRERERILREEERRRREDMERQREIERRQREEAARLEREREKLRRERERIEQEKAELLRLERERQKLEREKLERERLELKRQQMRLEESRRAPPPPSLKRSSTDRRDPRDLYVEPDRKRMSTEHSRRHSPDRVADRRNEMLDRVSDRRLDPSPPSRYESSRSAQDLGLKKEFKRSSDFSSRSSRPDSFSDVSRGREVIVRRESLSTTASSIDPRQVKERYDRPSTTSYTREREVRRSEPETHRTSRDSHTRYSDSFKPPGSSAPRESRYVESNRTPSGWHSGPTSSKSFNSVTSSGSRDPRNEPSSWSSRSSDGVNRWSNSSSMGNTLRHPIPPTYQSGPMQSMGLTAPGTAPSYERFDAYKSSMPMRKY